MTPAFIALGSNIGDPLAQLRRAVEHLRALPQCSLETLSGIYRSVPLGPADQPHYLNAVVGINSRLEPLALLAQLQRIETLQGRERSQRWGPRTLDLDLLLFGDLVMTTPQLTLPHPQMHLRN
ncbi:MAG: 2-amino-4-hydroxy-6-hydroxymethyldihydropteridine diphosphokinase, partial [Halioglobus sp.]|nr:2-amino-4-hydroxy-6-hydroxymethyldihydropteridine diphosphokinase [Halioglobus sp.]